MENFLHNKTIAFGAIIIISLFVVSVACYSQPDLDKRESNKGIKIQKFELINEIAEYKLINETGIYQVDEFSTLQTEPPEGTPDEKIIKSNDDPANVNRQIESKDPNKYNMFGDLLNDDPVYNKKYPIWIPIAEVIGFNVFMGCVDMYVFNYDFAKVGINSWKHNIETGWEWDIDRFGMNFLLHPYSGAINFLSARSNGYSYWESLPFAIGGSLMWEYFCENTLPAYNDIINTPISGSAFGEIFYRLIQIYYK